MSEIVNQEVLGMDEAVEETTPSNYDYSFIAEVEGLLDVPLNDQTSKFARWVAEGREWVHRHQLKLQVLISSDNARVAALPTIKSVAAPTTFQTIMNGISSTVDGLVSPLANGAATLLGGLGAGVGKAIGGIFSGVGGSFSSVVGIAVIGVLALFGAPRIIKALKDEPTSTPHTTAHGVS